MRHPKKIISQDHLVNTSTLGTKGQALELDFAIAFCDDNEEKERIWTSKQMLMDSTCQKRTQL